MLQENYRSALELFYDSYKAARIYGDIDEKKKSFVSECFDLIDMLSIELDANDIRVSINKKSIEVSMYCSTDIVIDSDEHYLYRLLNNANNFLIRATDEEGNELMLTFVFDDIIS